MKTYVFETVATMKEYNYKKYWIDSGIVKRIAFTGENLKEALEKYIDRVNEARIVTISKNAMKNKSPMYIDVDGEAVQKGYVITAKTYIEDRSENISCYQYCELWVEIYERNPSTLRRNEHETLFFQ